MKRTDSKPENMTQRSKYLLLVSVASLFIISFYLLYNNKKNNILNSASDSTSINSDSLVQYTDFMSQDTNKEYITSKIEESLYYVDTVKLSDLINTLPPSLVNNGEFNNAILSNIKTSEVIINGVQMVRKLNHEEKKYIEKYPIKTLKGALCTVGAWVAFRGENDEEDAIRHCFWSACLTYYLGKDAALELTNAHEAMSTQNRDALNMDINNNSKGSKIALSYAGNTRSEESVIGRMHLDCLLALERKELIVISPKLPPHISNPPIRAPLPPVNTPVAQGPSGHDRGGGDGSRGTQVDRGSGTQGGTGRESGPRAGEGTGSGTPGREGRGNGNRSDGPVLGPRDGRTPRVRYDSLRAGGFRGTSRPPRRSGF